MFFDFQQATKLAELWAELQCCFLSFRVLHYADWPLSSSVNVVLWYHLKHCIAPLRDLQAVPASFFKHRAILPVRRSANRVVRPNVT
jgi:hypothetical protein